MPPRIESSVFGGSEAPSGRSARPTGESRDAGEDGLAVADRDRRRGADRLEQAEAGEVGFCGEELEGDAQGGDHLVGPALLFGDRGDNERFEVIADDLKGGEKARLLVLIELVEVARRDRGGLDDLGDRR